MRRADSQEERYAAIDAPTWLPPWDGARGEGRGRTDDGGRTGRETDSTRTDTGRETEDGEETGREITTTASRQATRPPRPARSTTHVSSRRRLKAAIEIVHRLRNRVVLIDIDRRPDALATIPPAHPARTLDSELCLRPDDCHSEVPAQGTSQE